MSFFVIMIIGDDVMKIILEEAKIEELNGIIFLYGQLVNFECQFYYFLKKFENFSDENITCLKKDFECFIKDKNHKVIIAKEKDKIVGMIHGHIKDSYFYIGRILELEELVVDESYRQLGIAEKLYRKLIDWGKENNTEELHLNVFHTNKNALNFYEKMQLEQHSIKMKGKMK